MESDDLDPAAVDLENFTCDLLALTRNQPALQRLFQARKGIWMPVKELCSAVPGLTEAFEPIQNQLAGELLATWLDDPGAEAKERYAIVLFFLEETLWIKTAIFNRKTLLRTVSSKRPKPASAGR